MIRTATPDSPSAWGSSESRCFAMGWTTSGTCTQTTCVFCSSSDASFMRIPLRWLADYVDLMLPTDELARRLTTAGVEGAAVIPSSGRWAWVTADGVVDPAPHAAARLLAPVP